MFTTIQISAIIGLLMAFGVDTATLNNVEAILSAKPPPQVSVQVSPSALPQSNVLPMAQPETPVLGAAPSDTPVITITPLVKTDWMKFAVPDLTNVSVMESVHFAVNVTSPAGSTWLVDSLVSDPKYGGLKDTPSSPYTYDPANDTNSYHMWNAFNFNFVPFEVGTYTITFTAHDGNTTGTQTVTVTVK